MLKSPFANTNIEDPGNRNFLGRSEKMICDHFRSMGMALLEIQDAKGRRQIEINESPYYNIRYLLVNNICRWIHEEYIDNNRLESLRKSLDNKYVKINNTSWVEFSPRTDYLHTLNFTHKSLTLSHFLALCFVPAYNFLGFSLQEIMRWLMKNKDVKLELISGDKKEAKSWMAFWHGVGMIIEMNMNGICSEIVFYLPGGYKDFLEDLMNEYLHQIDDNKWFQECNEMRCLWKLEKNTGTEYWELYLSEMFV